MSASSPSGSTPRGELTATWVVWALLVLAIFVTYTRLDPDELYHVTRDGIVGGLSRALVAINFPIALVSIALVLVAMASLPRSAWWLAGPAIGLCAVTAVPGVVDDADLDARWINAVPAVGVAIAGGLGVAAALRSTHGLAARLPLDPLRWVLAGAALVLAIPWIFADLGVFSPEWIFIMERPVVGSDGAANPAVHLGHHHGLDGSLLVVSAALLSRVRIEARALWTVTAGYVSLLFAYGAVNCFQDAWNEQLWKRDLVDRSIPSAYDPALEPIWLVIVLLAVATWFALRWEAHRVEAG